MNPTVINTAPLVPECAAWLAERATLIHCDHRDRDDVLDKLESAQGLIIGSYLQVNHELLDRASELKVVGRSGVGLETIDVPECHRRGIQVVYTPEANTQAVVEYVVGLMLDSLRPRTLIDGTEGTERYLELRRTQIGQQLDQLTLGILGLGRIGKRLGAVAHSIGMRLVVNDLLSGEELQQAVNYPFEYVDLPTLFERSDILSIHVDGRSENRNLVGTSLLSRLRPGSLLINAARGKIVDTPALADWAQTSADHGCRAVLDVLDPEPPAADCPLFGLDNVKILPHLASRTHTGLANMSWVVRDIWSVIQGESPKYPCLPGNVS